jgi:hypothetical protein
MALSTQVSIGVSVKETTVEGGGAAQDKYTVAATSSFTDAAGALGATDQWNDQRTNATTTESLDLAGGVTNRLGEVKTFTKIKGLFFWHRGESGTLTIGGGSNPFVGHGTGTIVLRPGGKFLWVDESAGGGAVTAATGDLLQVVGTASILYDVVIFGE